MGVTPCRIHDKHTWVIAHGLRKRFWSLFDDDGTPALFARYGSIEWWSVFGIVAVLELGDDDFVLETRLTLDTF